MKTEKQSWENIIREAIESSGLSRAEIARRGGITQAQLSYFMSEQRSITIPTAEKIAKVVGLELGKRGKNGKHR